jgi:4-hydroxy-2-oxoglutarate aldolase
VKESIASKLRGVFAPIATPFTDSGDVALESLAVNLDRLGTSDLAGLVVLGSNGEACYLSAEEKIDLVSFVVAKNTWGKAIIAGTGVETTRDTVTLTQQVADRGADAALVLPPHYYKSNMTNAVLRKHYEAVADASPIPIIIYNMPGNTGINLSSDTVIALSAHPNIVGIKDSSGNLVQIGEIIAGAGPGFAVFAGSGSYLLPSLALGAAGATAAVANVFPNECAAVQKHFEAGELDRARELQLRLMEINRAVTTRWGVPGLKAAMDLVGYYGGPPRKPMLPLGSEEREELARIIQRTGFVVPGR